jgi:hypothetical protein
MAKLQWDKVGERLYETGVNQGVLYVQNNAGLYPNGVAWNGLTAVTENPSGAEPNPLYADNIKYLNLLSKEEFGATIEAYTYPDEFAECDGSAALAAGVHVGQQLRKAFGMAYKTQLGNDIDGEDYGYKLHLIYNALAAPSEKGFQTINDTPDAITFSWELSTTPLEVTGHRPTASIVIDSTKVDASKLATLENILFGDVGVEPRLPLPNEIKEIMDEPVVALSLVSISPDDNETDVAVDSDIVMTFNNKIVKEYVVVSTSTGVVVAGTKTWDSTGKVLTFAPTANLSNSTVYHVTITGVADVYSQTLATTIKNFATIA